MSNMSKDIRWKYSNFIENKNYEFNKEKILNILSKKNIDEAYNIISGWEDYKPTPLLLLNKLSKELNINKIFYKDESKRFNLKSFKALGGAYAVETVSKNNKDIVISTATAGNHGRSVAWGSKKLGLKCKIFISQHVSENRAEVMRSFGADVIRVNGSYEDSLNECINQSKINNWKIVQDVAWKDYELVPKLTMAGYSVMMKEINDQIKDQKISHIILQAGVGGMAAAMIAGIARYLNHIPEIILVEPESAACVLESIKSGKIKKIEIKKESIMGGMSCGEPSLVPWKILKNSTKYCVSVSDQRVSKTVKYLANFIFSDDKIVGGECSTPGIISLIGLNNDKNIRDKISLNKNSNVLIFGCEGDADEDLYQELLKKID
ncbi:MAG: diaminopropionate ammonia-lyase [Gammaproteobacteria bacterium]|nr:diaminopropionate ammonia-lyase [Gammaproteobacteria bacterium]|tara:strand:- start:2208 stop:3341 length:1134 start_codon:yes stop_codon:yes gene_type:complete